MQEQNPTPALRRSLLGPLLFTCAALLAACGVTIPNPAMGPVARSSYPVPLENVLVVMDLRPECELHPGDKCLPALTQAYAPVTRAMVEAVTESGARATVVLVTRNSDLPLKLDGYSHVWMQELTKLDFVTEGASRQGMQRMWVAYIAHRTTGRQMQRALELEYASDGVLCHTAAATYRNSSECQRLYRKILQEQLTQYRAGA
jgi:hypothetical protein